MKEREHQPVPYYQAARFVGEEPAGQAYFQIQDLLLVVEENNLSAYRFRLNRIWHVSVLGDPPPTDLEHKINDILSTGQGASIPDDVLKLLVERRSRATKQGDWVEGHYRPGKKL